MRLSVHLLCSVEANAISLPQAPRALLLLGSIISLAVHVQSRQRFVYHRPTCRENIARRICAALVVIGLLCC